MSNEKETKLCRHCRTEIPKGAKVCPSCRKKQGGKWKWVVIAAVIVVIAGVAGGSGDSDDKGGVQKVANVSDAEENAAGADGSGTGDAEKNGEKESKKDNKKAEKGKDTPSEKEKDADTEKEGGKEDMFAVGDILETPDFRISYLSAETYVSDNEFTQPEDGFIYYKMEFEFENISDSDKTVTSYDFKCYADGYDMEEEWMVDGGGLSATLSPGRKTKGAMVYEVPADSGEILLEYETDFWTEDKIVFKVK